MSQPRLAVARPSASVWRSIDRICNRFEEAWKAGQRPLLTDYLASAQGPERAVLLRELVGLEVAYRHKTGDMPVLEEYRQLFPEQADLVEAVFRDSGVLPKTRPREAEKSHPATRKNPDQEGNPPAQLGRYQITARLGAGGFGVVYRGFDNDLRRDVAIKVPHRNLVSRPGDAEAYLTEARTVASLDHPHIVPVYDVGSTPECCCFIVSRFIEGSTLTQIIKEDLPTARGAAELVATIAAALHYAHRKGLVHRDIKPGNILLDSTGKPFVVDFGLALRDEQVGQGPQNAGTPAYMSPEQARGEGHRVDGRSDIFSLGVVFYELLTGRRPFKGSTPGEVLDQIILVEPRPPRQVNDTIPKELERICLKALAKRASERYTTAIDLADDLRHFLAEPVIPQQTAAVPGSSGAFAAQAPAFLSGSQPVPIVPKGLRSFDAHDADFFLELLPGPRDREGLPASLRFWKTRIEETDPDQAFAVGLIYGPSGCGKSSLVKAGLLPRLAKAVTTVYLEATPEETESRLLKRVRQLVPDLPSTMGLVESLAALRRGRSLKAGQKVLLVLDQFEQWLHARGSEENTELVQALRQCDGSRVQAVVMVRDDFWLAVSRFMKAMEVEILEGRNSALVDLFDLLHARKVLAAFGRAYGRLPDNLSQCAKEQVAFLDQAVAGLAQEGKVISVRLALFAEMVKGKPWSLATLKEVGGTEGVGVTFLEETFAASTARPPHRLHQKAAQAVLKSLLPEWGTDIKGHMRARQELLQASGCTSRPGDFDALLRVLDGELRLITPTDPDGQEGADDSASPVEPGQKYYQLTHDYLVPSLRDWLNRKQKETRRGRAELLLADRTAVWNARPENRQLPSLLQWLQVRCLTREKNWTPPQRKMMREATRYHAVRGLVVAVLLALIGWGAYEGHGLQEAHVLRGRLLDANTNEVPTIVADMAPYRRWLDPLLREASHEAEAKQEAHKQLHTSLALLPVDFGQIAYLRERLLDAEPHEVLVIRNALTPYKAELVDRLWRRVNERQTTPEVRFRALVALAAFDPANPGWQAAAPVAVEHLLKSNPLFLGLWTQALAPVNELLLEPLSEVFRGQKTADKRLVAANVLAVYAADRLEMLADLVADADADQFNLLLPLLQRHREQASAWFRKELGRTPPSEERPPPNTLEAARDQLAHRQANAAMALLRLGQTAGIWSQFQHRPDPSPRTYLIRNAAPQGISARLLAERLRRELDVSARRGLILSLGQFTEEQLPATERVPLVELLLRWYREDPDPGLHGAVDWLLRHDWDGERPRPCAWGQRQALDMIDQEFTRPSRALLPVTIVRALGTLPCLSGHGHYLAATLLGPGPGRGAPGQRWLVNGQGQTLILFTGPVEFLMGSPGYETGRYSGEPLHRRLIKRSFAVASKPVTVRQFKAFLRAHPQVRHAYTGSFSPDAEGPILSVTWYEAVQYCRWLSEQEGIPENQMCYPPVAEIEKSKDGITPLKLPADYLARMGYRLPAEAEWEYACRAGALTSRYFGSSEELLADHAWYIHNSPNRTWPVGQKKPNDFGLFDMHGNIWNWCQESYRGYQLNGEKAIVDREDNLDILDRNSRVLRGGSFSNPSWTVRCANRFWYAPTNRVTNVGFRPARTFHVGESAPSLDR